MKRGKYIVIEGLDGSGKSTQHQRLLAHFGNEAVGVREPGGTAMGEAIRTLAKDASLPRAPRTNGYLFAAARAELADTIIRPALAKGTHVVADRNWFSTVAYQGAEGVATDEIHQINQLAMKELFYPDILIFLDTSVTACQARLANRGGTKGDYFDQRGQAFFQRVRKQYLAQLDIVPQALTIDGNQSPDEVTEKLLQCLKPLLTP